MTLEEIMRTAMERLGFSEEEINTRMAFGEMVSPGACNYMLKGNSDEETAIKECEEICKTMMRYHTEVDKALAAIQDQVPHRRRPMEEVIKCIYHKPVSRS